MAIKTFWFNDAPNFGDAMSQDVVSYVSGRKTVWAPIHQCELIAIGSIYPRVKRSWKRTISRSWRPRTCVWGSGILGEELSEVGFLRSMDLRASDDFKVYALRGPLTATVAGVSDVPLGDPGLLVDRVWPMLQPRKIEKPGLILHLSQQNRLSDLEADKLSEHFHVIDVRTRNAEYVVSQIASCPRVYSSSLHGLVISDAFNIPNWLIHPQFQEAYNPKNYFKYFDYGLSIDRKISRYSIRINNILEGEPKEIDGDFGYFSNLERTKQDLVDSFPYDIL
jgi:hypothetical protein